MSENTRENSHLDELEAEAIYIIREVAAQCEKPVMLYSIGKDSSVMLHLAMKAFYPEKPPFPFLHVNTTWKFKEMIKFRDETAKTVETIDQVREVVVRIGQATTTVAAAVEEQQAATAEIAHTAQVVADSAQGAKATIGTVGDAANQVGREAEAILAASDTLNATGVDLAHTSDSLFRSMRTM